MQTWKEVKKELLKSKEVNSEYKRLEPRYQLISTLIGARIKKGLTQKELAEKVKTKQSAIARIEAGRINPTIAFLEKISRALGKELVIQFR